MFSNDISSNDCEAERITIEKVQGESESIFDEGIQRAVIRNDVGFDHLFSVHLGLILATYRRLIDNLGITDNPEEIDNLLKKL